MMWTWVSIVVLIMGAELDPGPSARRAQIDRRSGEPWAGARQMADTLGTRRDERPTAPREDQGERHGGGWPGRGVDVSRLDVLRITKDAVHQALKAERAWRRRTCRPPPR